MNALDTNTDADADAEQRRKGIPTVALLVFSLLLAYNLLTSTTTAEEKERKRAAKMTDLMKAAQHEHQHAEKGRKAQTT